MPKAEEAEANNAEDTSVSEELDTSTNDDPLDEDSWDEEGNGFEDQPDTDEETEVEETSSDEAEEDSTEEPEAEEQSEEDVAEEDTTDTSEEEPEAKEEEDTPSSEEPSEKSQKELAHEAFKRREAERKLREAQDAREKDRLDNYLKEADGDEAELTKRQREVERHLINKERVGLNAQKLDVGIQKFAANSELLKSKDPEVQEAIAEALDDFESMYVVKDQQGNPVEVKADVYQYLQRKESSIKKLTGIGAREQAKKKTKEKARTVITPTRTPKEKAKDQDVDDFEKAFYGED